jgi:pimeloyl-ACP methyl ester carboxylesterase
MTELNGELWRDLYYASFDDLRLHVRLYPAPDSKARPAICLPGLTRNGRDFHYLASYLSHHPQRPRSVYCVDYRGRGGSQYDRHWRNYTPFIELIDTLDFMTLQDLHEAAIIGTSRGGIIAMMMAAVRPTAMGVVVLNDIGPVIEHEGMARISGYVGRVPLPISWPDAARMMRELNRRHFPEISEAVWEDVARQWYNEKNGKPAPGYDSNLGNALSVLDGPMPTLWPQFEALKRVPLMVVRGENSDILTAQTVDEMRRRHPAMATVAVPNQGHAPLLKDPTTTEAIRHFLTAADAGRQFATLASARSG